MFLKGWLRRVDAQWEWLCAVPQEEEMPSKGFLTDQAGKVVEWDGKQRRDDYALPQWRDQVGAS
jgi:hypothetical protein